jgi:hypothetical protein
MNNRVQQKFDRSIQEAGMTVAKAKALAEAELQAYKEREIRKNLPTLELHLLFEKDTQRMKEMLDVRARWRSFIGLEMDRKGKLIWKGGV